MPEGTITHIDRYPVKSMRGESLTSAAVGFQGMPGDRTYAFVQEGLASPFPWLTGRECPDLLRYQPLWNEAEGKLQLHVLTPTGDPLPVASEALRQDIERRAGRAIRLHADHRGNHDIAYMSIVATSTVRALSQAAGVEPDHRRLRMNVVLDIDIPPFAEQEWVGRTLTLGDVRIAIHEQDRRCQMITLDPENGASNPAVLKKAGELNGAFVGVYGSVLTPGTLTLNAPARIE
jgi:uncharacterized protein